MSSDEELRMSFTEHLGELRTRLIHSAYALVVGVVIAYLLSDMIFAGLAYPLTPIASKGWFSFSTPETPEGIPEPSVENATTQTPDPVLPPDTTPPADVTVKPERAGPQWMVLNPLEYIVVKLKIAGYGGLLLALPFIIWQICAFIFPGLHPQEKRAIQVLLAGCCILAILGVCVAYFGVFPLVLPYLMTWVPEFVDMQLRMNETLSILIKGIMGFAIAFQFPMGVLVLVYMDLLTPQTLKEFRKVAIIGMAVISAIFTPPDPLSMIIMLVPLVLLYEMSILLAQLMVWRRKKKTPDAV